MRHIVTLAACAALCFSTLARADESEPRQDKNDTVFGRRLFLPYLVGFGYDAVTPGLATYGPSYGLFSFGSTHNSAGAYTQTFTLRPNFDLRVGRVTLGLDSLVSDQRQSGQPGDTTVTALRLEPRVGYLVPLSSNVSFWPRVGLGYAYSEMTIPQGFNGSMTSSWTSVVGSVDALVVLSLGRHLFATAGPSLSGSYAWSPQDYATWRMGVGGSIGLGLAI